MAVAFSAFSTNTGLGFANTYPHTPSGTPRGVVVIVSSPQTVTSCMYGGVEMTPLSVSPFNVGATGPFANVLVQAFLLGAGVPTGTQNVTFVGPDSNSSYSHCFSVTADADVEELDSAGFTGNVANPSVLLELGGREGFAALSFLSDHDAVGDITPFAGWTSRSEVDIGAATIGAYSYDTIGTADVTAGWTQAADDVAGLAFAIGEVEAPLPTYDGALTGTAATASGAFSGSYATPVMPGVIGGQAQAATGGFTGEYSGPIVGTLGGQASAASGGFAGAYAYQGIWGVLGDSNSDEYNANDNRPAHNWTEMWAAPSTGAPSLEHIRGLDLGSWGTRSEPRRTGYANNYARSGSTMVDVLADQISPMAARVSAGEITHVVLFGTGNEWGNPFQDFYIDRIYNGNGTLDSQGANVQSLMNALAARYATAMDTIVSAGLIGGMVVVTVPRWDLFPILLLNYTDPTRLGYVGDAVQYCNGLIEAHAASVNASAGRTVVVTTPLDAIWSQSYATDDGTHLTIAGVPLIYTSDALNGEPNYFSIAPQTAIPHPGTVAQGALANTVIAAANELPGVYIEPFSDAEIRENAGIASEASGTLAGTAQAASGSFTGAYAAPEYIGTLSGTAGDASASFSGTYAAPTYTGALSGTAGAAAGDFTGTYAVPTYSGAIGGQASPATGMFGATYSAPAGVMGGQAGAATGGFTGAYDAPVTTGELGGEADPATGAFVGAYIAPVGGVLAGAAGSASGAFLGAYAAPEYAGVLAGVAADADGAFGGAYFDPGVIVASLRGTAGAASGGFAGSYEPASPVRYFSAASFSIRPAFTATIR